MKDFIEIPFLKVEQPIGEFYIGYLSWEQLLGIAAADIRKIEKEGKSDNSFDSYLGIQRKLSENRLKEISDYVNTVDATFPTSIILAIDSVSRYIEDKNVTELDNDYVNENMDKIKEVRNVELTNSESKLRIRKEDSIAKILDGQHRLEGLKRGFENKKEKPPFELNVTIFIDLDIDDQAQVFSVINKAQTKVNKSLVYDLYEYAQSRSPQKTAHDIVRVLNRKETSPFYKKIKILGTAENKETETIAQATFVEAILKYISKEPMKDRDILKRRKLFGGKKSIALVEDNEELKRRIFRNLFIKEKDEIILAIIWNYFDAVKDKWPEAWSSTKNLPGNILNKSTGLLALMRFLRPVYNHLNNNDEEVISKKAFSKIFANINLDSKDFNKEKYIPGSSGQSQLYRELLAQSEIEE
ncbi:MAG: DGQHR domain-containing protein [Melioribacteraceae bacterium]|nr:DGQHR domain-containing protein [Melioribacteraceae bacterium]